MRDFTDDLAALRERLDEAAGYLRIDELRRDRPQLETEASRPDLWDDPDRARKVNGELAARRPRTSSCSTSLADRIDDAETLFELGREEGDDSLEPEIAEAIAALDRGRFDELELRSLFTGEYDERRRHLRDPVGRGRGRRAGLGQHAAAHVPALGRAPGLRRRARRGRRRATRPASRRPRSS